MIQFTCPHCQAPMSVSDDTAEQSHKCLKCGRVIQVPMAGEAKGHGAFNAPAKEIERAEDGVIPLREESPEQSAAADARVQRPGSAKVGRLIPPVRAMERTTEGDIPIMEEPQASPKAPPREPEPAAATAAGLVVTTSGDALVVCLDRAKILDAMTIEGIGQELYALVDERGCRRMILDFSRVEFLSSQMLGVLMVLHKKITGLGGRLVLCAVRSDLQKVFKIVRLDKVLPIVEDRQTALET